MKKIIYGLLSVFLLIGCGSEELKPYITKNKFEVQAPGFCTEVNNLNEDASLQLQNIWKEFYVIVIDESKEDFDMVVQTELAGMFDEGFKGYSDLISMNYETAFEIQDSTIIRDTMINSHKATIIQITGKAEGIGIYAHIGLFEGKEDYYQLMAWTLKERKHDFEALLESVVYSFKEI